MSKYIDADRLREEIERRLDELNPKTGMFGDRPLRAVNPKTFPRESELEKVLYLITSLQQEQTEVPNGKFVFPKYLYARTKDNKTIDMSYAPQDLNAVEYVRNDFVEQEQPEVDLDAIVDEAFDKYSSVDGYGQLSVSFNRAELYSFIKKIARKEESK